MHTLIPCSLSTHIHNNRNVHTFRESPYHVLSPRAQADGLLTDTSGHARLLSRSLKHGASAASCQPLLQKPCLKRTTELRLNMEMRLTYSAEHHLVAGPNFTVRKSMVLH